MTSNISPMWTPAFESHTWNFQSYLVLPTPKQNLAPAGNAIAAEKWSEGTLQLTDDLTGCAASGTLVFKPGVELIVSVRSSPKGENVPALFEATGTGVEGVAKGVIYRLVGWTFCGKDGQIESVQGAVQAVRGMDVKPAIELGQKPVGTVGAFAIVKAAQEAR